MNHFRRLLLLIILCTSLQGCYRREAANEVTQNMPVSFPQKGYTRVVAYTYNNGLRFGDAKMIYSVYNPGLHKLCNNIIDSLTLSSKQTDALLSILNDTGTYNGLLLACYEPHHACVFYDDADTAIAWLDICLMCSRTVAMPAMPEVLDGGLSQNGVDRLGGFVKSLELEE